MGVLIVHVSQMCTCAHHSVWGLIVFTFIYYNSFPTSPLSVTKETTAVEKCVRQPWSLREAPHISTVISLLIHLIVDVKKLVRHFFVCTHPLYMRPQVIWRHELQHCLSSICTLMYFDLCFTKLCLTVISLCLPGVLLSISSFSSIIIGCSISPVPSPRST